MVLPQGCFCLMPMGNVIYEGENMFQRSILSTETPDKNIDVNHLSIFQYIPPVRREMICLARNQLAVRSVKRFQVVWMNKIRNLPL